MKDYVRQDQLIMMKIQEVTDNVDPISLLSKISIMTHTYHREDPFENEKYREEPYLHFLTGLLLRKQHVSKRPATTDEIKRIFSHLNEYFNNFHFYILDLFLENKELDVSNPIFISRLMTGLRQVNDGGYQYQFDDFIATVYSALDDYFLQQYGFTVSEAMSFGQKIFDWIQRHLDLRQSKSIRNIMSSSIVQQMLPYANHKRIDISNILQNWQSELTESNPKEFLIFSTQDLIYEYGIENTSNLSKYLDVVSCKFGDQDSRFGSIFNYNIIFAKPLIKVDDQSFFCPIPNLILNLHRILDGLLENEKKKKTKIWERYVSSRSSYLEDRVYEYFKRVFPEKNLYRNVFYDYLGKRCESDLVIEYDNKIIIVESKSAAITDAAKRGAQDSLKGDFTKIIQDAHDQGFLLKDYIQTANNVNFTDAKVNVIYQIPSTEELAVYVVNVTFEPLWSFSDLRYLRDLDLHLESGRLWSISLFDLETLTQSIRSPSIFIHYLEKRMQLLQRGRYVEFSELITLAYYLKNGNLMFPVEDEILLTPDWIDIFDNYYSYGKGDVPTLTIDPKFEEMISIIDQYGGKGHTKITSKLLDIPVEIRQKILSAIKEYIRKTNLDKNSHFGYMALGAPINTAIVIITDINRNSLNKQLNFHVSLLRYYTKSLICMGIGKDLNDDNFISTVYWNESPWTEDLQLKNFLEQNPEYMKKLDLLKSTVALDNCYENSKTEDSPKWP